jgi:hypothetical protein
MSATLLEACAWMRADAHSGVVGGRRPRGSPPPEQPTIFPTSYTHKPRSGSHARDSIRDISASKPHIRTVIDCVCCFVEMERTGIEPVASDLQIPGSEPRLDQMRSVNAMLRWLGEVEVGYSGTGSGHVFSSARARGVEFRTGGSLQHSGRHRPSRRRSCLPRNRDCSQRPSTSHARNVRNRHRSRFCL